MSASVAAVLIGAVGWYSDSEKEGKEEVVDGDGDDGDGDGDKEQVAHNNYDKNEQARRLWQNCCWMRRSLSRHQTRKVESPCGWPRLGGI